MGTTTQHLPLPDSRAADKFDQVWASLSDADRVVLLGHTHPNLTTADKVRLAAAARRARRRPRSTAH